MNRALNEPREFRVHWEIDQDANTATEAALAVWLEHMGGIPGRQPHLEDPCVFTVIDSDHPDQPLQIDLASEDCAHLFSSQS